MKGEEDLLHYHQSCHTTILSMFFFLKKAFKDLYFQDAKMYLVDT